MNTKDNRPTIREVAQVAGVSYQTVSRVLNDHPKVAVDTRERVLRAMKELGFQRNLAAQMLTTLDDHERRRVTVWRREASRCTRPVPPWQAIR